MRAYQRMVDRMKRAGLGLREHKLDNEASDAFKECINSMKYQLVPPGNHRCNQAERAIQTFNAHFISILAGVNDMFPLSLWCQLLELAELTLNLLRQSRIRSNISAYAHIHGPHDCMRKANGPTRMRDPGPRKAGRQTHLGHSLRKRIQSRDVDGALSVLPSIYYMDAGNKNQQHGAF